MYHICNGDRERGDYEVPRYSDRQIEVREAWQYINWMGAVTTKMMRVWFAISGVEVRRVLAHVMAQNKIIAIGGRNGAVWWLVNDSRQGRPSVRRARREAIERRSPEAQLRIAKQAYQATQIDGQTRSIKSGLVGAAAVADEYSTSPMVVRGSSQR